MNPLTLRVTPLFFERISAFVLKEPHGNIAEFAKQWTPVRQPTRGAPYLVVELTPPATHLLLEILPRAITALNQENIARTSKSGFVRLAQRIETEALAYLDGQAEPMDFERFEHAWRSAGFTSLAEVARALKAPYRTVQDYRKAKDGIPGPAQVAIELLGKQRELQRIVTEILAVYPRCKTPEDSSPQALRQMENLIKKLASFQ